MKYKVGDRVRIKSLDWYNENKNNFGKVWCANGSIPFDSDMRKYCGKVMTISHDRADHYTMVESLVHYWTDEMIEGLAEEETLIERVDDKGLPFNEWLSHKGAFHIPDGYELKDENGNVINATKIILEKKKKEYPKTYKECAEIVKVEKRHTLAGEIIRNDNYKIELLISFQKLLICRDAYWKIAGEEMGLNRPWKPDYDSGVNKYGIICLNGVVQESNPTTNWERHLNKVLDFPTAEMRDAFKENFDPDIEICKELL